MPAAPYNNSAKSLQSSVIKEGKPRIVGDYQRHVRNVIQLADSEVGKAIKERVGFMNNIGSVLMVPMKLEGRVMGIIQMMKTEEGFYDNGHLAFLEAVCAQLSVALANALLYEQAQNVIEERTKAEELLKKKTEELSMLYEAGKELSSSLDMNAVYDKVYHVSTGAMSCDMMSISSYSNDDNMIRTLSVWGNGEKVDVSENRCASTCTQSVRDTRILL